MDAQLFPDEKEEKSKSYTDSQDVDDDTSAVVGVSTSDAPEGPDAQFSLALSLHFHTTQRLLLSPSVG